MTTYHPFSIYAGLADNKLTGALLEYGQQLFKKAYRYHRKYKESMASIYLLGHRVGAL